MMARNDWLPGGYRLERTRCRAGRCGCIERARPARHGFGLPTARLVFLRKARLDFGQVAEVHPRGMGSVILRAAGFTVGRMTTRVSVRCAAVVGIALGFSLTGCANPVANLTVPAATPVATTAEVTVVATETATEVVKVSPAIPVTGGSWSVDQKQAESQAANDLVVTDITVGAHESYDRVVYTLAGEGKPGYAIEFVDSAVQDGSGFIHDTGQDKVLQVVLSGMTFPMGLEHEEYSGDDVVLNGDVVHKVIYDNWFEGQVRSFITVKPSVTDPVFSVSFEENPTRLVVDVASAAVVKR